MKLLSFTEAAEFTGLNIKTIRKHVQQGKLLCQTTPLGRRIPLEALLPYREAKGTDSPEQPSDAPSHEERIAAVDHTSRASSGAEGNSEPFQTTPETESPAADVHGQPLFTSLNETEKPQTAIPQEDLRGTNSPHRAVEGTANSVNQGAAIPLEAHLAALQLVQRLQDQVEHLHRRAEQSQRAQLELEFQLQKYQTALTDTAESLAEARALKMAAEKQLEEAKALPQLSLETPDLASLKVGRTTPSVPQRQSWWRRLFRTG